MLLSLKLLVAGLWPMLWHFGIGGFLIALCVFGALGTQLIAGVPLVGPWLSKALQPLRKDLLWAAAAIALGMVLMGVGARDEAGRCHAKAAVVDTGVGDAITKAQTPAAQQRPDPWDSKDN